MWFWSTEARFESLVGSMDSFWKGALSPFEKHRDHQHGDLLGHLGVNDADLPRDNEYVMLDTDPITGKMLPGKTRYYPLRVKFPGENTGHAYAYFIPANPKTGGAPTKQQIENALREYMKSNNDEAVAEERRELIEEFGEKFEEQ